MKYPSALVLKATKNNKNSLIIGKDALICGAVVLYGDAASAKSDSKILIGENAIVTGTLYCSGRLILSGKVKGSVYADAIGGMNGSSLYENCLINTAIDLQAVPKNFVWLPLFEQKKNIYEVIKQVQ